MMEEGRFIDLALTNDVNAEILKRLSSLSLPDSWLVSGSLFQAARMRARGCVISMADITPASAMPSAPPVIPAPSARIVGWISVPVAAR